MTDKKERKKRIKMTGKMGRAKKKLREREFKRKGEKEKDDEDWELELELEADENKNCLVHSECLHLCGYNGTVFTKFLNHLFND